MERIEYEKKDGTTGVKYKLQKDDTFTAKYDSLIENKMGKYPSWTLGIVKADGEEGYLQLTKTQAVALQECVPLTGKKFLAYAYTNKYGECVGVKQV